MASPQAVGSTPIETLGVVAVDGLKTYTADEVREIIKRGRVDPLSLTPDEIRAVCLAVIQTRQKHQQ